MAKDTNQIVILVPGVPPVKSPQISLRDDNNKRKKKLLDECLKTATDTKKALFLYGKAVRLKIIYNRNRGKMDAANIIGGIADILEGPFYRNDGQIKEVTYKEYSYKKKDKYEITLEEVQRD